VAEPELVAGTPMTELRVAAHVLRALLKERNPDTRMNGLAIACRVFCNRDDWEQLEQAFRKAAK
jgi:hypothetical protein